MLWTQLRSLKLISVSNQHNKDTCGMHTISGLGGTLVHNVQHWSLKRLSNANLVVKYFCFVFCTGGTSQKCALQSFHPAQWRPPKIACHKIQHFVNSNLVGLQSWHSSRHFQIPITLAISSRHWLQLWLDKHNYMWMWISQTKLDEEWSHDLIETWNIGCIDVSVIMQSSDGKYGLGWKFWQLEINQKLEGFAFGVGRWLSALCRESK